MTDLPGMPTMPAMLTVGEVAEVLKVESSTVYLLPSTNQFRPEDLVAARVLHTAAPIVLKALAAKDKTSPAERLPDAAVLPSGGIAL